MALKWRFGEGTQEGLKAVIVNPGVIMGSGFWHSGSGAIVNMVAKGTKYYTSGGVAIVDVRDVVQVMIELMENNISNEQFVLAGENMSYKDLMGQLASALEVSAPSRFLAKWKMEGLRKLDWLSSKLSGSRRRLLKSTVNSMYKESYYDGSKISRFIDFKYTRGEDTLKRVGRNYLEG